MKSILLIVGLMLLPMLNPGSASAVLTAKSDSGRTIFTAYIQDLGSFENASLKIDDAQIEFNDYDGGAVVFKPEDGVFTINYEGNDSGKFKHFEFWAIPNTFKIIENKSWHKQHYEFRAKIQATEPRPNKERNTPIIELNCTLTYEI